MSESRQADIFISVIVPVRNEEENIISLLNCLIRQSYDKNHFEVVIVNDHSEDGTSQAVAKFKQEHPGLNIVFLSFTTVYSKKGAITAGVDAARGEFIVTTDADCTMQETWLETIARCFLKYQPVMIIAPVMLKGNDNFPDHFQQYDYLALQMAGLVSAKMHLPLLCSGANLAFDKKTFITVNGYEGNDKIASGDDVFLFLKMNKAFPADIHILMEQSAIVVSNTSESMKLFLNQRQRWGSKIKYYDNYYAAAIGLIVMLVNTVLLGLFITSLFCHRWVLVYVCCFVFKYVLDLVFLSRGAGFFSMKINIVDFTIAEFIYPFYYLFLIFKILTGPAEWKGRKLIT